MAYIEKISDDKIDDIARDIARVYMSTKGFPTSQEFINVYLDVFDASRRIIRDRQREKKAIVGFDSPIKQEINAIKEARMGDYDYVPDEFQEYYANLNLEKVGQRHVSESKDSYGSSFKK